MTFLYTSKEVQKAIAKIFTAGKSGRRIAISAYVGNSAETYLPFPGGIEVICSPTPGATNPAAIRKLLDLGAIVSFVDKLHMKVYWAEAVGCVVTSANLSTNAMGFGGLKEAGVLLTAEAVDIQRLLSSLTLRPARAELHALDLAHREYYKRNRFPSKVAVVSFEEWFRSQDRERWKLLVCREYTDDPISQAAMNHAHAATGMDPHTWAWCTDAANVENNDWVLCAAHKQEDGREFGWLFVDSVNRCSPGDLAYWELHPIELVQWRPLESYTSRPPFRVDKKFKEAFWKVNDEIHLEERPQPICPGKDLLDSLNTL